MSLTWTHTRLNSWNSRRSQSLSPATPTAPSARNSPAPRRRAPTSPPSAPKSPSSAKCSTSSPGTVAAALRASSDARLLARRAAIGRDAHRRQPPRGRRRFDMHRADVPLPGCGSRRSLHRHQRCSPTGRGSRRRQEVDPLKLHRFALRPRSRQPGAPPTFASASPFSTKAGADEVEAEGVAPRSEAAKALRYPNATVSGDHYVLPVAVNYRHKVPGVVHRTSATGETIFVEPAEIAGLSSPDRAPSSRTRRHARSTISCANWVPRTAASPGRWRTRSRRSPGSDFMTAKAKFSRDFAMSAPDVNAEEPRSGSATPAIRCSRTSSAIRRPRRARSRRRRRSCRSMSASVSRSTCSSSPVPTPAARRSRSRRPAFCARWPRPACTFPPVPAARCRSSRRSSPTSATSRAWSNR